ncbi:MULTISPECIES: hypothetical protein [unclassified Sphingomonas]|nr:MULTISPECIES: hypothetical protein [unclassified Sphingomonas]
MVPSMPVLVKPKMLAVVPPAPVAGAVYRDKDTVLVTGQHYLAHDMLIPADEIYFTDGSPARKQGPWLGEADKVAWRDPATGYECIMMRDTRLGFLSGYVGVPVDHPLYGFAHDAVPPELGIQVHGGLTYTQKCADGPSPERRIVRERARICHVSRTLPLREGGDYRVEDDQAWWFGFSCNHIFDLAPKDQGRERRFLGGETRAIYRDDAYVCTEILNLAAQLKAIADGKPPPPSRGAALPSLGLDPHQGGRK